jgi:GDP-fucose protein O-fucosyltransferase
MAMESTIGLAVAMGRTLVMPPQKKMYLLAKTDKGQQSHFSFVDFFPIEEMAADNEAFNVVSMKEYLETEGMKGKLVNKVSDILFQGASIAQKQQRHLTSMHPQCRKNYPDYGRSGISSRKSNRVGWYQSGRV